MKTTIELPDELMRRVKLKAVHEDRRLKDVVAELLEHGLAAGSASRAPGHRIRVPLFKTARAAPEDDLTPERIAEILLQEDIDAVSSGP